MILQLGGAAGEVYEGLSTDTKPTPAVSGYFYETDTGKEFRYMQAVGSLAAGWRLMRKTYSSIPADIGAVTVTTGATYYMVGLCNAPGNSLVNLVAGYVAGATSLVLDSISGFYVGEHVLIDGGTASAEIATIKTAASSTLTFENPLVFAHADEASVVGGSALFTPSTSGKIRVAVFGTLIGNYTTDYAYAQLRVGSGVTALAPTGPTGPVAVTGTAIGNIASIYELTANLLLGSFRCEALLGANTEATNSAPSGGANLTVGTPYWFDLAVTSTTSGKTVQAKNLNVIIEEL